MVSELFPEPVVGFNDVEILIQNRDKSRRFVEQLNIPFFRFRQFPGFFRDQKFQIPGMIRQLFPGTDTVIRPFQSDLKHILIHGFGNEIHGPDFQAFNGQVGIPYPVIMITRYPETTV